jgi:hypothetical protein
MLDPVKSKHGNIQVGLGLKLPTGDYRYNDFFWKNDSTKVLGPVDQSIQLGDGGTGISLELNGYYVFTKALSAYGNFYYLSNPREHNGVSTARGGTTSATNILWGSSVMSVPDQYMLRGGLNLMAGAFSASAGVRLEVVPSEDIINLKEQACLQLFLIGLAKTAHRVMPINSVQRQQVCMRKVMPHLLITQ